MNIPTPPGAAHLADWVDENGDGTWGRYVRGTRRATAGVSIVLAGWQSADGAVEWHATVTADGIQLEAAALRKLAAAALDQADKLDQLIRQS